VDLVVVGAGISGLAAAWFWRGVEPDASILLLDNHDDFGGHARRVEFEVDGRRLISYGGSETLQSPTLRYGQVALRERRRGVELLRPRRDRAGVPRGRRARGRRLTDRSFASARC
jgi:cation diffusion facilitator CzcD-associated flavoprotein CzcO